MNGRNIIMVMGIPGAGKTTFANKLSIEMAGIPVICTDIVKAAFEDENPKVLSKVSHNAWQIIGECSDENIVEGYKAFSSELFKYSYSLAKKMLGTFNTVIIEGLGIDISVIDNLPERIVKVYLTNNERQTGYINKLCYRNNKENNWRKNSHAIELISKYIRGSLCNNSSVYMFDVSESDRYIKVIIESIL